MSLPLSREVGAVYSKAAEIAGAAQREMSTAEVLLAIFEVPNPASKLLSDRAISADDLRRRVDGLGKEREHLLQRVRERSQRLASGARSDVVTSLHVLAALMRESRSHAYALLESCDVDMGAVRTAVMSYATSSRRVPRRFRSMAPLDVETSRRVEKSEDTPTPIGFHPSLGVGRKKKTVERAMSYEVADEPMAREMPEVLAEASEPQPALEPEPEERAGRERNSPTEEQSRGFIENLRQTGEGLALDNHPGINRGGRPRPRRRPAAQREAELARLQAEEERHREEERRREEEAARRAAAMDDAHETTRDLAARLFARQTTEVEATGKAEDDRARRWARDAELVEEYELDEEEYPYLVEFGRNLTVEAAQGRIDAVIGRDAEVAQLIDILGKRRSNNPLLVGEPGVGKTAIVEGLARRLVELARDNKSMRRRRIVELEMGRLLSGTHLRGAFSERLLGIKDEVARAEGEIVVFLDEIHMWMGAGSGGDGGDAAGELKTALARGRFPCIGATTHDECRKFVESDPAFERRFQRVNVDEPDEDTALRIIEGVCTHYEHHHHVSYTDEALEAAVSLSVRYIHDRQLPDKAIGVLDLAGSRALRQGYEVVDRDAIARVVADVASIPAERLTGSDADRFLHMESFLAKGVVGHEDVVSSISELLRRNYAGFRSHRPIGSLLFLGPTGVGKTEMVKVLADFLFHDRDAIVRLDMSEFMEAHSVSRFVGAPPGYVGYDQGGQLTEAIRQRPYQVVLLDEIEKAHPDVLNLLLQLFDEGQLTDGRGRQVDFSNTLVVMTSNLGSRHFDQDEQPSAAIGFSRASKRRQSRRDRMALSGKVLDAAKQHFTPELWNRIDERLVFLPLSRDEVARIAELQLADSQQRLYRESAIELEYRPAVIDHLIRHGGYDPKLGARPMRQTIQRLVEGAVARQILAGHVKRGGRVVVDVEADQVVVRHGG